MYVDVIILRTIITLKGDTKMVVCFYISLGVAKFDSG